MGQTRGAAEDEERGWQWKLKLSWSKSQSLRRGKAARRGECSRKCPAPAFGGSATSTPADASGAKKPGHGRRRVICTSSARTRRYGARNCLRHCGGQLSPSAKLLGALWSTQKSIRRPRAIGVMPEGWKFCSHGFANTPPSPLRLRTLSDNLRSRTGSRPRLTAIVRCFLSPIALRFEMGG